MHVFDADMIAKQLVTFQTSGRNPSGQRPGLANEVGHRQRSAVKFADETNIGAVEKGQCLNLNFAPVAVAASTNVSLRLNIRETSHNSMKTLRAQRRQQGAITLSH